MKSKIAPSYDYLIVGAGFAGATLAERLASQLNKKILLGDKRSHIGGNAYDCYNSYRYYNMDQIVGQALATFNKLAKSIIPEQETHELKVD